MLLFATGGREFYHNIQYTCEGTLGSPSNVWYTLYAFSCDENLREIIIKEFPELLETNIAANIG